MKRWLRDRLQFFIKTALFIAKGDLIPRPQGRTCELIELPRINKVAMTSPHEKYTSHSLENREQF